MSVCLSARISPEPHMRSLPIFVDVAYGHSLVLLQRGDEIPKERGNFGVFFPIDSALYSVAFGPIRKRLHRSRCRLID